MNEMADKINGMVTNIFNSTPTIEIFIAIGLTLVIFAGFYFLMCAVFKATKQPPAVYLEQFTPDVPIEKQIMLPRTKGVKNTHWYTHTFERPRRKVKR